MNIATVVGGEVNRALRFLQDAACGGNLKQFLIVSLHLCSYTLVFSCIISLVSDFYVCISTCFFVNSFTVKFSAYVIYTCQFSWQMFV